MPDLPQKVNILLALLQMLPHLLQETVGHLISHVKADAIDIKIPDPPLAHAAEVIDDLIVVGVDLWHPVRKGKGVEPSVPCVLMLIRQGPLVDHEPVRVGGILPVLQHILPGGEPAPAVVEHRVHHDPDPQGVGLLHHSGKGLPVPEMRIDPRVIRGVILVVGLRLHDRVKVDPGDPQVCQVRKFLSDPLQVSPEALLVGDRPLPPGNDISLRGSAVPGSSFRAGNSPAEAVREDLVPDCVVDPVGGPVYIRRVHPGHGKALDHPSLHIHLLLGQETVLAVVPDFSVRVQFKVIFTSLVRWNQSGGPPDLMAEPLFVDDLLPLPGPLLFPAKDARLEGVSVMDEHPLHVVAGL